MGGGEGGVAGMNTLRRERNIWQNLFFIEWRSFCVSEF